MYKYLFSLLLFSFIGSTFLHAQMPIQNVLLQRCHDSYTNVYKHLKGNKAFAYARVDLGEKDYCVWSHRATSEENAQNDALQSCNQQNIGTPCKIVDINGKWFVKEGSFSSVMQADNTPISHHLRTQLISQAKHLVLGECFSLFKLHLEDKGHKVFAYSVDEDGKNACGVSKGHQTLRKAAVVALQICEDQRSLMKEDAPTNPCFSFSTGRKILVSAKDFKLALHKEANSFLAQDAYLRYVSEAEPYLSKFCLNQYKYYLRSKDHKAYYVAQDGQGNVVCGHSVGRFTISSAKKQALKLCEQSLRKEKLQATCQVFMVNDQLR